MKTAVTSTSLAAWDALNGAHFAGLQKKILGRMQHGKLYSRRQLAKLTKLETSCVAGRCKELIDAGAIVVCGTMKCPITERTVEALKRADEQGELVL